ncbi:MAG: UDP-N-acetylglucosamine 2-epimerase (non-hydrolyzing) [Nitrososphaerota archaeon]|nr:UDP-N-acetylglucosamine 2-epimerase (non-hydrolyzing) [Nitrososphaerota archaeon]MDG7014917.1 UDP-N-acetylglucosamine 2-epimerase (non-hydrolyzing) [Nitrososphaerota archaeon]WGO50877.1 MAG: UDP-N-acetylglucosamine 2-epimerase (non-hydrolyzing) [Nitrososphaerota archaeon]
MSKNSVAIVTGTRPSIIKFSPLIREFESRKIPFFLIHSGQHYSYNMDRIFYDQLNLKPPRLRACFQPSSYPGEQTAAMLRGIERILMEVRPKLVLVGGDANTNLAGALAARKLDLILGHVEAGLRSFDWRMPEEHNRIIIDHISDYLYVPSSEAKRQVESESVHGEVFVVGNPIVEAVSENLKIASRKSKVMSLLSLRQDEYLVCTSHRKENVDDKNNLKSILNGLARVSERTHLRAIFPVHPRTLKRILEFSLAVPDGVELINPLGYMDFLVLVSNSRLLLTDSGGAVEEACILKVPCVTIRDNIEWTETLRVGANVVAGVDPENILRKSLRMISRKRNWRVPFRKGAPKKIADHALRLLQTS